MGVLRIVVHFEVHWPAIGLGGYAYMMFFALKYAADAACTVLRVDQIIMAKPAGGPSKREPAGMDEDQFCVYEN
ncbi:T-complex protein 1 subunit theta-like [Prunus yedoensis var. nudiflora]|uniref:T-complex protein 1 subunit theta-like n=1 Tax=Prunus yedoensis var. nudiflora TaxID=2094558 RepID=A0A314YVE9_PRUYE|nr:T-complex protein 1 subunit theta-like [Prunus yedoensis var. nudiflora]